jgi:hypothetical protein
MLEIVISLVAAVARKFMQGRHARRLFVPIDLPTYPLLSLYRAHFHLC